MRTTVNTKYISIFDGADVYCGADQNWFRTRSHRISGCGPTTAALITMYMAQAFTDECAPLYPYECPSNRDDFVSHMGAVRQYVRPGPFGLTNPNVFAESVKAFAESRGVKLMSQLISPKLSASAAYGFLQKALAEQYLPALLILRNPYVGDFTWHWMAVTGYDDDAKTVIVSSHGKEHVLSFDEVWQQEKPYYAAIVYFYPI